MNNSAPELKPIPMPEVFQKGLENVGLDPAPKMPIAIPYTLSLRRSLSLASEILNNIPNRLKLKSQTEELQNKDPQDLLKLTQRGRRSRGPCHGCMNGTEDNHHGGRMCKKRGSVRMGTRFQLNPRIPLVGKISLISSGLR